jgi:hypothetical protein
LKAGPSQEADPGAGHLLARDLEAMNENLIGGDLSGGSAAMGAAR